VIPSSGLTLLTKLELVAISVKAEKYFRTMLMPATYEKLSPQVHVMILDVQWLSFTTDSWTNPMKSCSLLSFTAHFLHQSERRKVILAAMVLEQDHTDQS